MRWGRGLWGGVLVALGLLVAGAAQDATTDTVVTASAGTAHLGVGYRFPDDGWIWGCTSSGTAPTFCIDLNGGGPSTAGGYVVAPATRLKKQVGWSPDHRGGTADALTGPALTAQELGRLAYLTDRYAATTSPETAAAAEHVVRLLTVGDAAQSQAREGALGSDPRRPPQGQARLRRDGEGRRRARRPLHADRDVGHQAVRDHAGQPQDHPAVRRERRHARGRPDRFGDRRRPPDHRPDRPPGHRHDRGHRQGPGQLDVAVTARGLAPAVPLLYTPENYADRGSPDHAAQRTVGAAPRASLSATASTTITGLTPKLVTTAAPRAPAVGDDLTDAVAVTGALPGWTGTADRPALGSLPRQAEAGRLRGPRHPRR